MKSKLLLVAILAIAFHQGQAQQMTGRAYYKASNQIMITIDSAEMSPEEISQAHEIMKKPWERDFILTFTQTESNWRQAESLAGSSDTSDSDGSSISLSGAQDDILYKDLTNTSYIQEQEFMGKEFLILDALEPKEWKLSPETKKIGNYLAQKATYTQVVEGISFSPDMAEMENVRDTLEVTVWYTPEIPVAHGPEDYFGLPGLILEVHNGGRAYYCEKIELNPSQNPIEIRVPKGGKVVTSREFQIMQEESIQQMQNRYQGKPGGENGKKIRIGG